MIHGMSDVTDIRGFTSYLENWGVTRLPTLVLFRKGRAQQYPHKGASFQLPTVQEIEAWLSQMTASDAKWSSRENARCLGLAHHVGVDASGITWRRSR